MENKRFQHEMYYNCRMAGGRGIFLLEKTLFQFTGADNLLNSLLKAGLVLIHGGVNELIDVVFQIFDEGSIISFLLPA